MTPKRGAYPAEVRAAAVRMLQEGRDPADLARELGVPRGTLRVWHYVAEGGEVGLSRKREDVIERTVGAYERLDRLVRGAHPKTPMRFAEESLDPWRVQDALAHVTHYKARAVHRLTKLDERRRSAVQKRMDEYFAAESWKELEASDDLFSTLDARTRRRHGRNHLVYVRWRDRPGVEVVAWHRLVHKYVVSMLKSGPEEWFNKRGRGRSLSGEAVSALSGHVDVHIRDIERA